MKHQFSDRHKALMAVIRDARESARVSQRDLSLRIGRAHNYVHKVEIGERSLDYLEAIDLAEALGLDPFDLLDRVINFGKPAPKIDSIVVSAGRRRRPKGGGKVRNRRKASRR